MKAPKQFLYSFSLLLMTLFVVESLFAQIEFIENRGQWDSRVKFMSDAGSGSFFLTQNGFTVSQYDPDDMESVKERRHESVEERKSVTREVANNKIRAHSYSVEFLNSGKAEIVPDKPLPTYNNYFIGNDKSKWASNCKIYLGVTYKNMYPGIDLRYYVDGSNNLKYDLIVHPGAKVDDIAMRYTGAEKLAVKKRELNITTPMGVARELHPYTYQIINNEKKELDCRYVVNGNVVKFKVKGYSPDQTLIIDPVEIFFSYSGSTIDNWGFTATYGPDGSFYGGGIAWGSGFPASPGAYDETFNGTYDIGIIKLSPDGRNRIYGTYIGGSNDDQPHSLIVDAQGNLVLAGRSNSDNYPTTSTLGVRGGWDIVVTKLNASGGGIIGSMKIGGGGVDGVNIADENSGGGTKSLKRNYGDDSRSEVLLDASNNIYVASCTQSDDFPTTPGAYQTKAAGMQDAVVLKLDPSCNSVLFSSLLGGTKNDAAYVLALGGNNSVYVAGGTASNDLKGISASGVLNPAFQGGDCDGFIIEMNNTGTAVLRGTYIGTPQADQIYGIETDKSGNVYVMGTSEGSMPVINANYFNPGSKQFISKINPDLSSYVYSTVFGSNNALFPNISPTAFLVDRCENVYVSGWGGKSNLLTGFQSATTKGMPVTPDAIKRTTDASGSDFYFFVLEKNAASILYGSFFGQEDPPMSVKNPNTFGDHVDGGTSRFDRNGVIYQAICANCYKTVAFPGTPGAWSLTNRSVGGNANCNLGMVKIEMDFSGVRSGVRSSIDGVPNDTVGCIPLRVDFSDTLRKGKLYYWYFGDGTGDTTTVPTSSHIYQNVGVYNVMLVSIDSATCNVSDTSYTSIKAGSNKVFLDFISQKIPPCTNLAYNFTNTSTSSSGNFNPNTFTWNFGDGTPPETHSATPPVMHTYAGQGTYQVMLSIDDSDFCNSPKDTLKTVRLSPQVTALFDTPANGCVPYNAIFTNNSLGGLNFLWDFGDGTTSTEENPTHLYPNVGNYVIKLTAFDSTSCNKLDSKSFNISVSPIPGASFRYTPIPPQENMATSFTNQSIGATHYIWQFGDGDSSLEKNPQHIFNATGTFNVCLTAINDAGCSDDTCMQVQALIRPLVDVPSAFTPGKFGVNGSIRVAGFGIKEMHWSIYNRWGQKIFETNSFKSSWDGTFKGKLQPMDAYAYTLDVVFSDGTKARKTGDITLIR
ncbi:MAG: PKD domain-containing protein [Ginsengibacter sp.]